MKKITALLLVIIALTACTGKEQGEQQKPQVPESVVGTWQITENSKSKFAKFPACTFKEDGTFAFAVDVPDPTSKDKRIKIKANFIGTYKLEGEKLLMTFPDSIDVPKEYAQIKKGLQSQLAKKGAGRDMGSFKVTMNDSTLVLTELGGTTLKLMRVPAIKE